MSVVIPAEVYSDDRIVEVNFDALPFFQQASAEELQQLAECGWGGDYPADQVAIHCADDNADVQRVFDYLGYRPRHYGETVGFECHVEEAPALEWLKANRPEVYKSVHEFLVREERI